MTRSKTKVVYDGAADGIWAEIFYEAGNPLKCRGTIVIDTTTQPSWVHATYRSKRIADAPANVRINTDFVVIGAVPARRLFDFKAGDLSDIVGKEPVTGEEGGES